MMREHHVEIIIGIGLGILWETCFLLGCASGSADGGAALKGGARSAGGDRAASGAAGAGHGSVAAYVNDWPIGWDDLRSPLVEVAGGQVFGELILDGLVQREVSRRGLTVGPKEIDQERAILAQTLDEDPDQSLRLMEQMRRQRGLGQFRWERMLARTAGLRALVGEEEEVGEGAVRQEYQLVYGDHYEARVVVCSSIQRAGELVKEARSSGRSLAELAEAAGGESGENWGGEVLVLNLADARYPAAVRSAVGRMAVGEVSDPVALEGGFAVLKLERKINGEKVGYDDVKERLSQRVRLRAQSMRMRQLSRALMSQAEVVVLDPVLKKAWEQVSAGAEGSVGEMP